MDKYCKMIAIQALIVCSAFLSVMLGMQVINYYFPFERCEKETTKTKED